MIPQKEWFEGVTAGEFARILQTAGFQPYEIKHGDPKNQWFKDEDGELLSIPADPNEIMWPRVVQYLVKEIRMKDKEFARLRQAS